MFNTTHTFVGLAIARTGLDDWAPRAALTAAIAANLPDIDILAGVATMPSYLNRGMTHSLAAIPLLSLALSAVMYLSTRTFWRTFVVALIAMATHPVLDYANTYGLRPFLPFDGTWYYGDTLYLIDPIIDVILLIGILSGQVFKQAKWVTALSALLIVVLYVGYQTSVRNEATVLLDEYTAKIPNVEQTTVVPRLLDPWTWDGIVETRDAIFKMSIDTTAGVGEELARLPKIQTSKLIDAAAAAPSALAFLQFARFPVSTIHGLQFGYRVTFLDFRFYNEVDQTSFAALVEMDQSLSIVKESVGFNQPIE